MAARNTAQESKMGVWPTKTTKKHFIGRSHWVYRIINNGQVAYVGMTCNLVATKARHKNTKLFEDSVVVLRWAGYCRETARRIERNLVEIYNPPLNKTLHG